ncbi:MAG: NAD-dependent epimerase/dehydratase family protein [Candidatus Binataceae bacterium]
MSVLVTGAAGNIGSNIVRTLLEQGERVVGYDVALPPQYSVVHPLLKKFPFVVGSVVDLPLLLNTIKQHKIENVIHLAAIMAGAKERPVETVQVNVMGTMNVLEAGRILGLRRVICTSSFAAAGATGKDQSRLIPETEFSLPVNARDGIAPYASTKLMCEELTYMYRADHGVDAAIIRPARVYGPGLPRGRSAGVPIQAIFEKAIDGESVLVPQGADTKIDLTYVKDEVRGFLLTYRAASLPNWLYNISAGRLYSMGEIAAAAKRVFPKVKIEIGPGEWRGMSATDPHTGPVRPASDISRARKDLGYEPQFADLEKALTDYKAWEEERRY